MEPVITDDSQQPVSS